MINQTIPKRYRGMLYTNQITGSSYFINEADQCFFKSQNVQLWIRYVGGRTFLDRPTYNSCLALVTVHEARSCAMIDNFDDMPAHDNLCN